MANLGAAKYTATLIAEKLGYLALALSQAVAYMAEGGIDLEEYLERLCDDLGRFISMPYSQYAEGVLSCWKLSVQALQESNPDAITLLRLCSFLSPEGVSKELLSRGWKAVDAQKNGSSTLCLNRYL